MTLSDCVVYCTFSAGLLLWLVCFAVIERDKLAGLPSGVWLALRALVWAALLAAWFAALAAAFGHARAVGSAVEPGVAAPGTPPPSVLLYSAGGAVVSLCVALALTVLGVYLYRNLWQLGAVQPRLRRRAPE